MQGIVPQTAHFGYLDDSRLPIGRRPCTTGCPDEHLQRAVSAVRDRNEGATASGRNTLLTPICIACPAGGGRRI